MRRDLAKISSAALARTSARPRLFRAARQRGASPFPSFKLKTRGPLTNVQIGILCDVFKRGGFGIPVTLTPRHRASVLGLWHRGLVQIWYRQSRKPGPSDVFYSLTFAGARLADIFAHHRERSPARG